MASAWRNANVKVTARRQAALPRPLNLALLAGPFAPMRWLALRVLPPSQWENWCALGAVLTLLGLSFTGRGALLSRGVTGALWRPSRSIMSGSPAGRTDGSGIRSIRACCSHRNRARERAVAGGLAAVLALAAFAQRIVIDERFMRQQFGPAYDAHAQRVRRLIPGVI